MANKKNRPVKTFKNPKTGHVTSTSLPVEQNRLRAQGYVEDRPKAAPRRATPAATPKATATGPDSKK